MSARTLASVLVDLENRLQVLAKLHPPVIRALARVVERLITKYERRKRQR